MKAATVKEIKQELENLPPLKLLELTLRLIKYKKENKELLTYLLFEAHDEQQYINGIKESLHLLFTEVNIKSIYITKKNIRKIIRIANRFIKYSQEPITQIEIHTYICNEISDLGVDIKKSAALLNIYNGLLAKIEKGIMVLHEDLQYDYLKEFRKLRRF